MMTQKNSYFIGLQILAICLLTVLFNRMGEHSYLLLHMVGVSLCYPSCSARGPGQISVPNTVLIWLFG